eukprot:1574293-Pyramimonas_sp.AAC.1
MLCSGPCRCRTGSGASVQWPRQPPALPGASGHSTHCPKPPSPDTIDRAHLRPTSSPCTLG